MIKIRKAQARGHADHGWLKTFHSFSFANYYDPQHMGFRHLRVLNQDVMEAGMGFGEHGHRDMEIISVVLEGALEHRDSLGNGSVIRAGEIQLMSAGTGITHSEFNHSKDEPMSFLQMWILPNQKGLVPSYAQQAIPQQPRRNAWCLLVSPDGREDSLPIHQDVCLYATQLDRGKSLALALAKSRHAWLQVIHGSASLNGLLLADGDGAAVSEETSLELVATRTAEILLFDLA